jgi:hypothetical protein
VTEPATTVSDQLEDPVVVVFRTWRAHPRTVIALFPQIDAGRGMCSSYEHMGQHGGADYAGVIARTRRAEPDEYAALKRELEAAPFGYRLIVRKRAPH